jgi:hypothetical protein
MPPKKKPSAKGAEVTEKELLAKAQAEIVALNRLLELKTYEVQKLCTFLWGEGVLLLQRVWLAPRLSNKAALFESRQTKWSQHRQQVLRDHACSVGLAPTFYMQHAQSCHEAPAHRHGAPAAACV